MNKSGVIKLAKPWQAKAAIPDKKLDRLFIAWKTYEFNCNHGIQETSPIIERDFEGIKARSGISASLKNRSAKRG